MSEELKCGESKISELEELFLLKTELARAVWTGYQQQIDHCQPTQHSLTRKCELAKARYDTWSEALKMIMEYGHKLEHKQ